MGMIRSGISAVVCAHWAHSVNKTEDICEEKKMAVKVSDEKWVIVTMMAHPIALVDRYHFQTAFPKIQCKTAIAPDQTRGMPTSARQYRLEHAVPSPSYGLATYPLVQCQEDESAPLPLMSSLMDRMSRMGAFEVIDGLRIARRKRKACGPLWL
jgi:hypothetical protein